MIKKILVSAIISLPFPFVLFMAGVKLGSLSINTSALDFMKSDAGLSFYGAALVMFVVASTITSLLLAPVATGSNIADEEGDGESGPEGKETGTVKWFNVNKGFGFITTDAGEDIFVHFRSIRGRGRRSLRQGQAVRFDTATGDKGLQAENVSVAR